MFFRQLFDRVSCTYTYLLADPQTNEAVLIDPVKDQFSRDVGLIEELGFTLRYTFETHVHADHITASGLFRQKFGSRSVISATSGVNCADILLQDEEVVSFGNCQLQGRTTPGHTSGCMIYVNHAENMVFTGDTLFIRGCGRTDFQQGSSEVLYHSVHNKIYSLPDEMIIYPGHDYRGRTASTVGEEKRFNPRLRASNTLEQFVQIMKDLTLSMPKKIDVAVPANLHCGLTEQERTDVIALSPLASDMWAPIQRKFGVPEVDVKWLRSNLNNSHKLIDVREPSEYANGHIKGAENVPLASLSSVAVTWNREQPIVLICHSGKRSGRGAISLAQKGFEKVASLAGGMLAWGATSNDSSCG